MKTSWTTAATILGELGVREARRAGGGEVLVVQAAAVLDQGRREMVNSLRSSPSRRGSRPWPRSMGRHGPRILTRHRTGSWSSSALSDRTNDDWLRLLSATGPMADAAIADLREVVRRGLHKALRGHPGADDALIEDVTQESILKVLGGLSDFRGDSKLTTWAVAVAVRVAFSELRRARLARRLARRLGRGGSGAEPAATPAPSAQTEKDELIARMRHVIDTELSERQRFLLVAELNGVPQAELSERLGLNPMPSTSSATTPARSSAGPLLGRDGRGRKRGLRDHVLIGRAARPRHESKEPG